MPSPINPLTGASDSVDGRGVIGLFESLFVVVGCCEDDATPASSSAGALSARETLRASRSSTRSLHCISISLRLSFNAFSVSDRGRRSLGVREL